MNVKEKWILWLKATTITVISVLLLLEVAIVINESLKILNKQQWGLSCSNEAIVLACVSEQIQLGPSVHSLKNSANFIVNKIIALAPPFNLIILAKNIINFF